MGGICTLKGGLMKNNSVFSFILYVLIFLVLSTPALVNASQVMIPIKGTVLPQSSNFDSICRIDILIPVAYKKNKELVREEAFCSAVLIDKNKLLTSAHCLWDENMEAKPLVVAIKCGAKGSAKFKISIENTEQGFPTEYNALYPEEMGGTDSEAAQDLGIVSLPTGQEIKGIEPLKIASTKQIEALLGSKKRTCRISGYGQTAKKDGEEGKLYTAELNEEFANNLEVKGTLIRTHAKKSKNTELNTIAPGDSGGGLYCLLASDDKKKDPEWVLLGINRGGKGIVSSGWFNPNIRMYWALARTDFVKAK